MAYYKRKLQKRYGKKAIKAAIIAVPKKRQAKRRVNQSISYSMGKGVPRSPFPPNLWTTFTYSLSYNALQGTMGVPETTQFRMNGPYDPVVSVSLTNSPRYWDSLLGPDGGTAPYRVYRCHASKIDLTIFPKDTTAGPANCLVSIIPQRSGTATPGSIEEMRERQYSKHRYLTTVGSTGPVRMTHFTKTKTHLGHGRSIMQVDATGAAYNGLPTEQIYWNISQCAVDATQVVNLSYVVTLTYFCQLYTLADVADS